MNSIIKISEAASLAFHSLGVLAKTDKKLNVKKISEIIGSSDNHLSKVMQRLSKEGIIKSVRGPKGGFFLAKSPEEIGFLEIYEIIEGKIIIGGCPLDTNGPCPFNNCLFGGVTIELTQKFRDFLKSKTVADIM